jgi:putative Mn2+ efflux pump MntP
VLAVVLFAVAISVDGFIVGIAQGMRGIGVPLPTLIVINIVSTVIVFLSLSSGRYVAYWLSPGLAKLIGSGILIAMGALMLKPLSGSGRQSAVSGGNSENYATKSRDDYAKGARAVRLGICEKTGGSMGDGAAESLSKSKAVTSKITGRLLMVPKFLAEPATADLDSSGTLTPDEGFFLGLALAIDGLSIGFGAGMAGISSAFTPIVAGVTQGIFVSIGLSLGRRMRKQVPVQMLEKAPGGILILLGAMRLK